MCGKKFLTPGSSQNLESWNNWGGGGLVFVLRGFDLRAVLEKWMKFINRNKTVSIFHPLEVLKVVRCTSRCV